MSSSSLSNKETAQHVSSVKKIEGSSPTFENFLISFPKPGKGRVLQAFVSFMKGEKKFLTYFEYQRFFCFNPLGMARISPDPLIVVKKLPSHFRVINYISFILLSENRHTSTVFSFPLRKKVKIKDSFRPLFP